MNGTFLGHARAEDIRRHFNEIVDEVEKKKLLQIGMDGPNVNLKFLKDLKVSFKVNLYTVEFGYKVIGYKVSSSIRSPFSWSAAAWASSSIRSVRL